MQAHYCCSSIFWSNFECTSYGIDRVHTQATCGDLHSGSPSGKCSSRWSSQLESRHCFQIASCSFIDTSAFDSRLQNCRRFHSRACRHWSERAWSSFWRSWVPCSRFGAFWWWRTVCRSWAAISQTVFEPERALFQFTIEPYSLETVTCRVGATAAGNEIATGLAAFECSWISKAIPGTFCPFRWNWWCPLSDS